MIYDVVTSSGSLYRIDVEKRFWSKHRPIPTGFYTELHQEPLLSLMVGTKMSWPWNDPTSWEKADMPEVGKHLYIASTQVWFASTPIKHIIPVEGWDIKKFPLTVIINGKEENADD